MANGGLLRRTLSPLGRLLEFRGRTRRVDFWPFMLLLVAIYVVGTLLVVLYPWQMGSLIVHMFALTAILILLAFAAVVRRLHDVDWSGRWMAAYVVMALAFIAFAIYWRYSMTHGAIGTAPVSLIRLAPMLMPVSLAMDVIALLVFVLCLLDGTAGPNKYGADPKGRSAP